MTSTPAPVPASVRTAARGPDDAPVPGAAPVPGGAPVPGAAPVRPGAPVPGAAPVRPGAPVPGAAPIPNAARSGPAAVPVAGNAATVAAIYAAFGRGDVPAILDHLADDVAWDDWAANDAQRAGVRHLLPRRGVAEAAEFFTVIGGWTVRDFAVLDVIGDGPQVVAEIRAAFELPDGGRFADEELHLWTFDAAGRVARFRHYVDTAKHIRADRGEDTTRP